MLLICDHFCFWRSKLFNYFDVNVLLKFELVDDGYRSNELLNKKHSITSLVWNMTLFLLACSYTIIDCSITSHLSLNYCPDNYYWSSLRVEKSFTIKMSPHNFCGTCCNAFPSCHAWPTDIPGPRWRTYTTTWSLKGYGCFTAKTKWRKGENYLTAILQPKSFFANGHLCLNF